MGEHEMLRVMAGHQVFPFCGAEAASGKHMRPPCTFCIFSHLRLMYSMLGGAAKKLPPIARSAEDLWHSRHASRSFCSDGLLLMPSSSTDPGNTWVLSQHGGRHSHCPSRHI